MHISHTAWAAGQRHTPHRFWHRAANREASDASSRTDMRVVSATQLRVKPSIASRKRSHHIIIIIIIITITITITITSIIAVHRPPRPPPSRRDMVPCPPTTSKKREQLNTKENKHK